MNFDPFSRGFGRLFVFYLGLMAMLIAHRVPIIGPIIGGFFVGLVIWSGMLMGLITGAFSGLIISVYYTIFVSGVINLSKNLGNNPYWTKLGFLGSILRAGPIVTFLYFIILGAIGGYIGGLISERK